MHKMEQGDRKLHIKVCIMTGVMPMNTAGQVGLLNFSLTYMQPASSHTVAQRHSWLNSDVVVVMVFDWEISPVHYGEYSAFVLLHCTRMRVYLLMHRVKLPHYSLKDTFTMTAKDRYFFTDAFYAAVKAHPYVELLFG